jgi:hypothetical protein
MRGEFTTAHVDAPDIADLIPAGAWNIEQGVRDAVVEFFTVGFGVLDGHVETPVGDVGWLEISVWGQVL